MLHLNFWRQSRALQIIEVIKQARAVIQTYESAKTDTFALRSGRKFTTALRSRLHDVADISMTMPANEDVEHLQAEIEELNENNEVLSAIIDGFQDELDDLREAPRSSDGRCFICGRNLPTDTVRRRHLAFHRFEINEYRHLAGLSLYHLETNTSTQSSSKTDSPVQTKRKGHAGSSKASKLDPPIPRSMCKRAGKRQAATSEDSSDGDRRPPRVRSRRAK